MQITKYHTLAEAKKAAAEILRDDWASPIKYVDVLRPDGDTDRYFIDGINIATKRTSGWITHGMSVCRDDTPCIIS